MTDAAGQSPHDYPEDYALANPVIPDGPMTRRERQRWMVAVLQARQLLALQAEAQHHAHQQAKRDALRLHRRW